MNVLSVDPISVAHGIHYAVVGVGLAGLFALLGPQLVGSRRTSSGNDEHALRVTELTNQISSGGLGVTLTPMVATWGQADVADRTDPARSLYLPIAVASSAAAAGVHAALGPAHFRELAVFGMFFAGAALAQIGWAAAMILRPSRRLLVAAVVGNSAILLLWLVTRTIGLPGLLAEPEAVGLWDLSCGAWELAIVLSAGRILRADSTMDLRLPAWPDWRPSARTWALGSASLLPVLALFGVGT